MSIFKGKKKDDVPLAYIKLSFNLTAMDSWIKDKSVIKPLKRWNRRDDYKEHNITMLPQTPELFYHDDANQFSPSIAGYEDLGNRDVLSVEWAIKHNHFIVYINDEEHELYPVFIAPLDDMQHLLANRRLPSGNSMKDMEEGSNVDIPDTGEKMYCSQVHKSSLFSYGLIFSNALVQFSVVCVPISNLVQYK